MAIFMVEWEEASHYESQWSRTPRNDAEIYSQISDSRGPKSEKICINDDVTIL